jgi:hypothetical protein
MTAEPVVVGRLAPHYRLFTPWPAWDATAFIRKLSRGEPPCTVPHPSGLHGWYQPTGMGVSA